GVKIEYVKRDKKISLPEQMKRDNIQIVVGRSTSDVEEKTENLILTTPFVDGNFSLVSTKDFNLDKREGKVCATQHYAKLLKTEKPSKVIRTDTVDDVIELILSGKADYGIVSACSIQYALNNGFYPNIRFVSMADNHVSATYAVSKDADLKIVSIINKAILAYAAEDVPMYLNERMVNSTRKLSVKNLIVMYPFETFAFCIVVTACIFTYLVFWIRRKNKIEKNELESKEKVYREKLLSAISNNIDTVILIFDEKSNNMEYVFENSYRVIGIKNSSILKNPEKYYKMQPEMVKELVESRKTNDNKHHSFLIETLNPITNKNMTLRIAVIPFELDNNMKYIITVDDATEELKNKENLQKALSDSIIANTAKSRFLSNMSHEMRTPLSAIIGMTEIVNEKIKSNEPLEDSVEKIDSSARYMLQLVNDVLDMSKISEGKITIKKEVFNMREMLNFVADLYQVIAKEKNVTLISDFSDNIPELVVSDQVKIKQVFVNLLSNAVKYNKQNGKVECSVKTVSQNENTATLRFEIKDNGIGIKPENLAKIFTPFEREERASEEIVKGTGLGLPIAKNIVDALGGELEVRSEFNVGSEFSFEITLELPKAGDETTTQNSEEFDNYDFSNMSFLVVEDSNINALIIERLLKMKNAKVDIAENGKVGCDKFSSSEVGAYSAIIMDLRMPIMDGYEATKSIRAMDRADAKTVKIIALSADAYVENMEIAIQAGMNTYCTKPIEKEKLFKALQD
ncbi:MAG: ATP-binding protein, partial [Clostridia bacterium]